MVLTATFLRLPTVASPKACLGNNRSIGMASATLTTFFTLPSRRSSQIRRSCAFASKLVYAASAHLAINNDASVLSENLLVKARAEVISSARAISPGCRVITTFLRIVVCDLLMCQLL